jgi:hypothetical protein
MFGEAACRTRLLVTHTSPAMGAHFSKRDGAFDKWSEIGVEYPINYALL